VRNHPALLRNAFEESLRWDSPSRMAGRITTRTVQIDGFTIPAGQRTGLLFAAANRDPRAWEHPDTFDVDRNVRRHVGFGYGMHACVGRSLAQMEASVFLGELLRRTARIEMAGPEEPWMTTIGHGPAKLPVRLYAAEA
jgi:4-methoxybenzoate monooxygenase (O-demethylating)